MLDAALGGADPTAHWRRACAADLQRQYGGTVAPAVPATFVLQWYVGAIATALAHLAVAQDRDLGITAGHLSIALSAPGGYPVRVGVDADAAVAPAGPPVPVEERMRLAERRYREHADRFAAAYDPGPKMSSQHRNGSVADAWQAAQLRAAVSAEMRVDQPRWRASCCFIYVLPGAHECARCPRLRAVPAVAVRPDEGLERTGGEDSR